MVISSQYFNIAFYEPETKEIVLKIDLKTIIFCYLYIGVKKDPPGWWSNATYEEYNERAKCVEDQYSSLVVEELPELPKPRVNGSLTFAENIADLGGNRLAYYAYRK